MNARQSLKIVSTKLEEAQLVIKRQAQDIAEYNKCIDSMIMGYGPCPWCEDFLECSKAEKTDFSGCSDWWLAYDVEKNMEAIKTHDTDNTEAGSGGGAPGGTGGGSSGAITGSPETEESDDAGQPDTDEQSGGPGEAPGGDC